ncbi:hypothetical protein DKZ27_09350 [Limosilactobacillus reuteri]|nr:hypothetical protein [Limosilactobacillus reuteri]PWT29911.1 hypothetical protein DKZ27_09350 [Limosilactobacillus reuteri]
MENISCFPPGNTPIELFINPIIPTDIKITIPNVTKDLTLTFGIQTTIDNNEIPITYNPTFFVQIQSTETAIIGSTYFIL